MALVEASKIYRKHLNPFILPVDGGSGTPQGVFGGVKSSGVGRNLGYEGIVEFQEYHSISGPDGWLL